MAMWTSEECTESGEPASLKANKEQALPEVVNSYLRIDDPIQCFNRNFNEDNSLVDDIAEALLSKQPSKKIAVKMKTLIVVMRQ